MQTGSSVDLVISEYNSLLELVARGSTGRLDLSRLDISRWMTNFEPNPLASASASRVRTWSRRYGIWLDKRGPDTETMGAYLHPSVRNEEILDAIGKFYQISWYIDDVFGNDLQKTLTPSERVASQNVMDSLAQTLDGYRGACEGDVHGVVRATGDLLSDFRRLSNPDWMDRFVRVARSYFANTARDLSDEFSGVPFSMDAYLRLRNDVSTMWSPVVLTEFATGGYVSRPTLREDESSLLGTIERSVADLGSLSNDLFSFEKELVDCRESFNAVSLYVLSGHSLEEAVSRVIQETDRAFDTFLRSRVALEVSWLDNPAGTSYLRGLDQVVAACWHWQLATNRYQREKSIFLQTDAALRRRDGSCR